MIPSVGRIVHYVLREVDVERIMRRRRDFENHRRDDDYKDRGYMAHFGNDVRAGDVLPAIIVRAWGEHTVNAQVYLDGTDTLWMTSIPEGEGPGTWSWPPRV